jgi:RHS repeat-associated protein
MRDHLGSIHALVDGSGTIVESYSFDAFGRVLGIYNGSGVLLTESAIGNRYLWQGREYSFKTGMYYFRARYYDPVSGRWLSNDPLGIAGGLNQYVFCANNPVNFRDPDGRTPWMLIGAAVGGGLDLAVQLAQGSGFSGINWVSVVASATSGALGVGLGANVARLTASVAARAALNAAGSAAIGAGVQVARNGIEGNPLGTGVRDATVVSGVLGGVGSATGDLIERGIISMSQNSRYIQNLLDGGALEGSRPGYLLPGEILPPSAGSTAGTAIGIGISNMGPLLPSGGSKSCP